ncbi:MAG TPA: AAA family ATPase [Bacilli bacterium]
MLIRFKVENFLSFNEKQEINMIPGKKMRKMKDHIVLVDDFSLLRAATIYGANASGKSNFIEAIRFAKYVITEKVPLSSTKMYCRTQKENANHPTTFEFEFYKNNHFYAYGFSLNLHDQTILTEWLYELFPKKKISEKMLFERETNINRIDLSSSGELSDTDKMRFTTYKLDFEDNKSSLFLKEMNRNKKITRNSKLLFFKNVYEWFNEDLITIFPDQTITNFEYFYGSDENNRINDIIEVFDTGISKIKVENVTLAQFKERVPSEVAEDIIADLNKKMEESDDKSDFFLSLRSKNAFYNLKGQQGGEPIITTIMLEHGNAFSDFEFSEESDGTRRLFDLLDILINGEKNKVYIIDEMERSLHPKLTYKFIEMFFEVLKDNNIQLIFTTHESTIMDQDLLRRDEIWFVERNKDNVSHLYSLDRFKERYDKKLNKAYLEGRYGAIPILKNFSYKDWDGDS